MNVKEHFNIFTKERIKEDKGRNLNLLSEIYADTELFDLTFLEGDKKTLMTKYVSSYYYKDKKVIVHCTEIKDISLPFANCFVKVEETEEKITSVFIRDYSVDVITGAVNVIIHGINGFANLPFTIKDNTIVIDLEKLSNQTLLNGNTVAEAMGATVIPHILFTLLKLNCLSSHTVIREESNKAIYYRRKGTSNLKVVKPLYYVLDKKQEKAYNSKLRNATVGTLSIDHSFAVRGHWRRISSTTIGKNRKGEYLEYGRTWVKDHIRGNGELCKKIRVLK